MYSCCSSLAIVSARHQPDSRRDLESAGAPARVEIQVLVAGAAHDRGGVGTDVHDARPGAQQVCPREDGEQLHGGGHLAFDDVERAALAVPVVGVDTGAHHEFTLVCLRHVDVHGIRHHDRRVHGLEQLGDQRLKGMALQRRADAEHVGQRRGVPGRAQRDLSGADVATCGAHPGDAVAVGDEPGDLAVLDDVDAGLVGAAREAPGDVVVFGDAGARLIRRAEHRVANVAGDVDDRAQLLDLVRDRPTGRRCR